MNFVNNYKKVLQYLSVVLLCFTFYGVGWVSGQERLHLSRGFIPKISLSPIETDFSMFWKVYENLQNKYDGKLDKQKLLYGAITGMVNAAGDQYTYFMTPEESKQFEDEFAGSISGIGAEVGMKANRISIIAPLPDSPAQKAGLKPNDIIDAINDFETTDMTVDQAVEKIRGQEGTAVKLKIIRGTENLTFNITREIIEIKSVSWIIKDNNIGYLHIKKFSEDTAKLTDEGLDFFKSKNVKGIVIDMRNNPGGLLDKSIDVSSQFIKSGNILIEKNEGKVTQSHKASGLGKYTDPSVPIVVLVNEGSASAAEIVAGALSDHKRATLMGKKTFGKGSVQELITYGDSSILRVTTAHWYTPNDKSINERGLTPDIDVAGDDATIFEENDPVIKKALEFIKTKL